MRVFLIIIYVVMFYIRVVFSKGSVVKDITDQCVEGRKIAIYLTTGAGETDFHLSMIASSGKLNCSIQYFVTETHYVLFFLELPDVLPGRKACLPEVNSLLMVSGALQVEICKRLNLLAENFYKNMAPRKLSIFITSQRELTTVKMTATALRHPKKNKCDSSEVECIYKAKLFCMSSETRCDGFANCGEPSAFDEDIVDCHGSKITMVVIISSIVMTLVSFWLLIAIIMSVMPKRKETFVYQVDESISVFDVEMGHGVFDITVEVLFPEEKELDNLKQRTREKEPIVEPREVKKVTSF